MENPLEDFTIKSKDEDIISTVTEWVKDAQTYHDALLKKQKISEEYYKGNQTDMDRVPHYLSNTVENRIFEAIETIVPVVTSKNHHFKIKAGSLAPDSKLKAQKLQKVLARKYETLNIQEKLETVTRKVLLYRFGVLKYEWDKDADDLDIKEIDPRLIMIPKLRVDPHDSPYVIELQAYTYDEIEQFFPKVNMDDLSKGSHQVDTGRKANEPQDELYEVFEVWTKEMVAWISGTTVLDKKVNPYYDFEGQEAKIFNDKTKRYKKITKFTNHLNEPEYPYVFFGTFNVSDGPLPCTSLVEQGIPIQDDINVRKRAILNNLKQMGNGQGLADADALTEEQAENITNEPGLIIRGHGVASENKFKREPGVPLPAAHFSAYQSSQIAFDNLMGIHTSTRGAGEANTLGQDIISRQQDFTRIDTITRILNRGVARLSNGLVQLMRMFYTVPHLIKIVGEEEAPEIIKMQQDDIEDHIEIDVKSGVNLPMDDVALRTEAVQLWQLGAIDPISLYEALQVPEPEKSAQRLLAWKQGQLMMETNENIRATQAGAQAQASAKAETPESAGQGRGSEGMLDVLARAKKSLGGTASTPMKKTTNEAK